MYALETGGRSGPQRARQSRRTRGRSTPRTAKPPPAGTAGAEVTEYFLAPELARPAAMAAESPRILAETNFLQRRFQVGIPVGCKSFLNCVPQVCLLLHVLGMVEVKSLCPAENSWWQGFNLQLFQSNRNFQCSLVLAKVHKFVLRGIPHVTSRAIKGVRIVNAEFYGPLLRQQVDTESSDDPFVQVLLQFHPA